MAGPKFYIYGGCRWREVCTTSGRVDGWGNVQFLAVRSGRLQVARKDTVLRGLRALAASRPTSVHDGLPLSQIRHNKSIEDKKEHNSSQHQHHHCCCKQQDLSYKSDVIFNNIFKAATTCSAAVQCSLEVNTSTPNLNKSITVPSKTSETRTKDVVTRLLAKRKRSTSEDESRERNKDVKSTERRKESDGELEVSLEKRRQVYNLNNNKYDKRQTNRLQISSSEDEGPKAVVEKTLPQLRSHKSPVKSKNVLKAQNGTKESLRSYTINNKQKKLNNIHSSSDDSSEIQSKPASKSQNIDKFWNTLFKSKPTRRSKRKLSSSDDTYEERKASKTSKRIVESDQDSRSKRTQDQDSDLMCKELMIGEDDIQLLRSFIEKDDANIFGVDLELFDTNDDYKRKIFYKINPLVNVGRCKRIAAMLRERRSQSDNVSLEDFISTLGLRSVLDVPSQSSKYKMRARRNPSTSGQDKENHRKSNHKLNSSMPKSKVLVERLRDANKNKIASKSKAVGLVGKMSSRPVRSRKGQDEVVLLSSDSDSESAFEKSKRVTSAVRAGSAALKRDNKKEEKASGAGSKKANRPASGRASGRVSGKAGREYTRAEDEAIVAWVRGAERARRVNGNQLWIELQPLHQQKTGQFRSWHSLRNRYLRYVLPALGALALPPPEAVRLRAAAAAGELKSRKKPQRRNSLLIEPRVRSAWSRRPRPPARESPSPSRSVSPARSSSPSPPVRADSSHYSSRISSSSSSTGESTPIDRRRSLRNSSAKKAIEEKPPSRKLRSSAPASPPRTPTYSQLTQRFADARPSRSSSTSRPPRPSSSSRPPRLSSTSRPLQSSSTSRPARPSSTLAPPRPSPPASPARPRTRRLYNPNAT
ncbi:serine/arginine repetitive matrix protein 2-like [Vanessa cardui]|uniref:serine/arginine repetitive matrix protein 2-like n=1 Tax=Vanessa cardui TaxID=171605 RepID=UPI001F134768|nr:serine/arginine repetitive matrix protein 2-like [Vanessa cardui]